MSMVQERRFFLTICSIVSGNLDSQSVIVIIFAMISIAVSLAHTLSAKEDLADDHFDDVIKNKKKISKKEVSKEDKLYLKALINMKYKEIHLNLKDVYGTNSELFTREALVKQLYK
jgi:uncharacterized membrane protein